VDLDFSLSERAFRCEVQQWLDACVPPEVANLGRDVATACGRELRIARDLPDSGTPLPCPRGADTAFVLHASGTTGQPKPVPCRHNRPPAG
jgi:acyl-coenzyme A synthetase/AMP-(fatty) acid ligase